MTAREIMMSDDRMRSRYFLRLLGEPAAEFAGGVCELPARRDARELLLYLSIGVHNKTRFEIATTLWPDGSVKAARQRLRRALHRLRVYFDRIDPKLLVIHSSRDEIELRRGCDFSTDIDGVIAAANVASNRVFRISQLRGAVSLGSGHVLLDRCDFGWVEDARAELANTRRAVLERCAMQFESLGDFDTAREASSALASMSPIIESEYQRSIRLSILLNDSDCAIDMYSELCARLEEELGIPPSQETQKLMGQLGVHDSGAIDGIRVLDRDERRAGNVLDPIDSYVDPHDNLRRLDVVIGRMEQVTLIGPGGIGKTRLALEYASRFRDKFQSGVWLVDLTRISKRNSLEELFHRTTGINPVEQEANELVCINDGARGRVLVIVDNCEHVLSRVHDLIDWLASCKDISLIATSRVPLDRLCETVFDVRALTSTGVGAGRNTGDPDHSARKLLIDRMPDSSMANDALDSIDALCERLQGNPLGLEIIAAQTSLFTPREIDQQLTESLILLPNPRRSAPIRHESLMTAMEWGYRLMSPSERQLLQGLSVFVTSFSLDATNAIAAGLGLVYAQGAVGINTLVGHGFASREKEGDKSIRYSIPYLVRQFVIRKMDAGSIEIAALKSAILYYKSLAQQSWSLVESGSDLSALHEFELEHDNVAEILQVAPDKGLANLALDLAGLLWRFWYIRGYAEEALTWIEALLDACVLDQVPLRVRARARNASGVLLAGSGKYAEALCEFAACRNEYEELGEKARVGEVLIREAIAAIGDGRREHSLTLLEQSAGIALDTSDDGLLAGVLAMKSHVHHLRGDNELAIDLIRKSISLIQDTDATPHERIDVYLEMGRLYYITGQWALSEEWFGRSLEIARQLGSKMHAASIYDFLGQIARKQGRIEVAKSHFGSVIETARHVGDQPVLAAALCNLAELYSDLCEFSAAQLCMEESLEVANSSGDGMLPLLVSCAQVELHCISECGGQVERQDPSLVELVCLSEHDGKRVGFVSRGLGLWAATMQPGDQRDVRLLTASIRQFSKQRNPFEVARALDFLAWSLKVSGGFSDSAAVVRACDAIRREFSMPRPRSLEMMLDAIGRDVGLNDVGLVESEGEVSEAVLEIVAVALRMVQ